MGTLFKLHASQPKQLTQTQTHPFYYINVHSDLPQTIKSTIFYHNDHTNFIIPDPEITPEECKKNLKDIYTTIISQYLGYKKKPHFMTFIHQNKHYYVTCIQNWLSSIAHSKQITSPARLPTDSKP